MKPIRSVAQATVLARLPCCIRAALAAAAAVLFAAFAARAAAQTAIVAQPGLPVFVGLSSYIDNANPEPARQLDAELDAGYSRARQSDSLETPLALTYGILPRWDATIALGEVWQHYTPSQGPRQTESGLTDMPVKSRLKLLDQEKCWASGALELEIKVPTGSRRKTLSTGNPDYDLAWLATRNFTDKLTADVNVGYGWLGNGLSGPLSDQLHYGAALEYQATEKWSFFTQIITTAPTKNLSKTDFAVTASIGRQLTSNFSMHAAFTKGSDRRMLDYSADVGVVWSFNKHSD